MDPVHHGGGVAKTESDIYSFGVVLFEMLSGMLANSTRSIDDHKPQTLINLVRSYYDGGLEKLTDPCIINQIDSRSFQTFKEVAYQCISLKLEDRPKMDTIIKKIEEAYIQNQEATSTITLRSYPYQNLKSFLIPLKAINMATKDLSKANRIGDDGNGTVYKGILSEHWQNIKASFKRYNASRPQAENGFHNEFTELATAYPTSVYLDPIYNESRIIRAELDVYSFGVVLFEVLSGMLAFSKRNISKRSIGDDQPQTLLNLVRCYDNGGRDNLIDPQIRDQINIHSFHVVTDIAYQCISLKLKDRPRMNRVIKSIEEALYIQNNGVASTITQPDNQYENLERFIISLKEITLATEDFSSKCQIGDGGFGVVYRGQLSNRGQTRTVAIKRLNPQGTDFYIDPAYRESGILRKESDVYSFGVVMFELVSGMLAYHRKSFGDGEPQPLINLVRRYYKDGLEKLIDPLIRDQIDSHCFYTFKELAFECISLKLEERPTMDTIMERIEDAMDFQEHMKCKRMKS
ncbi:hypothetical protein L1887_17480 [Cichorium endivia]|nr:hypothetical protein L1887_17480 [Cichorium endivia]